VGDAILGIGSVSIAVLLLIIVEGTFAVIFLAILGLVTEVVGLLTRRTVAAR
jgi:hypothetical protein